LQICGRFLVSHSKAEDDGLRNYLANSEGHHVTARDRLLLPPAGRDVGGRLMLSHG
jgi:hypothetical protein